MGTKNLLMLKTHFRSIISTRFVNDFVYTNMVWVFNSLRVFAFNYVLHSFGLILKYIFRIQTWDRKSSELYVRFEDFQIDGFGEELVNFLFTEETEREREIESSALMESFNDVTEDGIGKTESSVFDEDGETSEGETEESVFMEAESELDEDCDKIKEEDEEEETLEFVSMEIISNNVHGDIMRKEDDDEEEKETEDSVLTTRKYEYVSGRDISGFIEEPTVMTFSFLEFYVGPHVSHTTISELKSQEGTVFNVDEESVPQDETSKIELSTHVISPCVSEVEITEIDESEKTPIEKEESIQETGNLEVKSEDSVQDQRILFHDGHSDKIEISCHVTPSCVSEAEISETDESEKTPVKKEESFQESGNPEAKSEDSVQEQRILFHDGHSASDQFSLKSELFGGSDSSSSSSDEDDLDFNENSNSYVSDSESESSSSSGLMWANSNKIDDDSSITFEFLAYQNALDLEGLKMVNKLRSEDEFIELNPHEKGFNFNTWDSNHVSGNEEEEENLSESESEEDFEWEEDDLVEQMKMELRNARQGGLATILEEEEDEETRESPNMGEDLKPLKIEERHEFKDQIAEIQKVHKSYEEKMRKLDILNYQTMHALGLLQLKDPKTKKPIVSHNLWAKKEVKNSSDPLASLVKELQKEWEIVYVGQVCLSWEILCWQHEKARELNEFTSRRYNVVAGEFQLLQVLMQRFIENEPFQQGPRIQNYVKNRCVIRNLLQVPSIKDDSMKDKMMRREEEDAVTSVKLEEMIKESMRVFWEFIRADKDDNNVNVLFKVSHQSKKHLKDPAISDLLIHTRTHLHKKEKRLKEIVRSGNCIVRKFKKQNEDKVEVDHDQLVAQVELKLVSRVLNMSKLRKDQLIWCNEKLKRITFVDRKKIQVDHSFLLFPF